MAAALANLHRSSTGLWAPDRTPIVVLPTATAARSLRRIGRLGLLPRFEVCAADEFQRRIGNGAGRGGNGVSRMLVVPSDLALHVRSAADGGGNGSGAAMVVV
jgi:hypothetical protein